MQMSNDLQRPRSKVNEVALLYKTYMQVMPRKAVQTRVHMCYGILCAMQLLSNTIFCLTAPHTVTYVCSTATFSIRLHLQSSFSGY